jgi:uncharacterized protein (TIGR02266 family)
MKIRGPRYRVAIQVNCATRGLFVANRITNISRGGLFIEKVLPLNSEVDLSFCLPDSQVTIGAKGRVAWTYDIPKGSIHLVEGSGIRFVEMPPEERQLLEDYLKKLTPIPPELGPPGLEAEAG